LFIIFCAENISAGNYTEQAQTFLYLAKLKESETLFTPEQV